MTDVIMNHGSQIQSVRFSRDGERLVTAGTNGEAVVWDLQGREVWRRTTHGGVVKYADFSPDRRWIVTAGRDGLARLWNAETGDPVATLKGHKGVLNQATFSNDSKRVVTCSLDRAAMVWIVDPDELIRLARERLAWRNFTDEELEPYRELLGR